MAELEKSYNPKGIETKWYEIWSKEGYFKPEINPDGESYSIVIPPPNVTGSLHMGHALNATLQDVLARWKRMCGSKVLWLPGTDHAGIATQNVVERQLASDKLTRQQIGRDKFIEKVWQWKAEYGGRIIHQLKSMGASCDWSRERFTLDEGLSKAVKEVFVRLYEEGLIYRENRLINWCPRCHTALSDLEVEHEELNGKLTYMKYPLADEKGFITVATTRPETMLGDSAVAVNPSDERYKKLIGKFVSLPLTNRKIPVIGDPIVDMTFGTGAVKVTPAHDFNDETMAKNQTPHLPFIIVIDKNGMMTSDAGAKYAGIDRYTCRKQVVNDLKELGLIEKEEIHKHAVGYCYRCKTTIEPLPTLQWYVKIKPLAEKAIDAVRKGKITITPESWNNSYFGWMENIKDWCISRQIWWGHRIPAWYCQEMKNEKCRSKGGVVVSRHTPEECPHCGSKKLSQDDDVLDTWFSSALWPFSTLGWPDKTSDLKTFYPTSVLITAFDILFFWVARMIMMGLKFMEDVPFKNVYIHAIIRDQSGQKMSKSKGNVVDPLIIIDKYGTDAFRFTLCAFAAQGRDIKFAEERVEGYRHFVNKLWNAARFIMMNVKSEEVEYKQPTDLASRWILSRLSSTVDEVNKALEDCRFNDAANSAYQFVWHELCDWYIEMSKAEIGDPEKEAGVLWCLVHVFETTLRLLHPFMPFVTEEIWQNLPKIKGAEQKAKKSIMISEFPKSLAKDQEAETKMWHITEAITGIRNIRGELNVSPAKEVKAIIKTFEDNTESILNENIHYIKKIARASGIETGKDLKKPSDSAVCVRDKMEIYIPLKDILNIDAELDRLNKENSKIEEAIEFLNKKLTSGDFVGKAPEAVVKKEKAKHEELLVKKQRIKENIIKMKDLRR